MIIKAGIFTLLSLSLMAATLFAQSSGSLRGKVTDAMSGLLTSATVTATNTETGVEQSATVNAAGVYNFPSLPPGVYTVVAKNASFKSKTMTDVRIRAATQSSLDFSLEVMGTTTEIEVVGTAENMILESGASTGTIMQENLVSELPLVGSNVMELLNSMGGVIKAEEPIFGASNQSFAGINGGSINITRDGVAANEIRYNSGVVTPSYLNPELVGEFKMILSPVDAELGRGAGQVQITTKSGSNTFHGSGIWNNQNTVLDARKFEDKRQGLTPPWRNLNNYTLSASGPIIKNKTFFFASWDQQIVRNKEWVTVAALTNCAKKGIYRYYDGVVGINPIDAITNNYDRYEGGNYPRRVTVTSVNDGTPKLSSAPVGTSGQLMYRSVFDPNVGPEEGKIHISDINGNCASYTPPSGIVANAWNADRNAWDTTGYVNKYLGLMPETNYFGMGDGLNTAGIKWWRTTSGSNNIYGTGEDNRRKQFTIKLDHNVNSANRLSGTYTIEKNEGEDGGPAWPENSYIGRNWRKPQGFNVSLTSTVSPTLLNEFRFGYSRLTGYVTSSIDASDGKLGPILKDLVSGMSLPHYKANFPMVVSFDDLMFGPGANYLSNAGAVSAPFASRGVMNSTWGGTDNRYTFADTITWIKGSHSFKGGAELRTNQAYYTSDGEGGFMSTSSTTPMIRGGNTATAFSRDDWNWEGIRPYGTVSGLSTQNGNSNQGGIVANMLNFLAGGVADVRQYFYIVKDGGNYRWNNINANENVYVTDLRSREFSAFFKDDWRVTRDLTLNLGIRYEYYGVPWNATGMTVALKGGNSNIMGEYGTTWMNWMGLKAANPMKSEYEFVGPGSDHSNRSPWNRDMNNFAPHVGFAWQLPWLGRGLTTLRGGYSISYSPVNNFDNYKGIISTVTGTTTSRQIPSDSYVSLATVGDIVGNFLPTINPMNQVVNMAGGLTVYDENIRNPYTQSMNLSLTRQLTKAITVDVRYIGNLSRKQLSSTNLNAPNYMSNGLIDEFNLVRANGPNTDITKIPILNAILPPSWAGNAAQQLTTNYGVFSTITYGNGMSQLAQGDYNGLAQNIATVGAAAGLTGNKIKAACSGENPAVPCNLIYTNPELQSANITTNSGFTNYHSMQAQVTMRPLRGLSFQLTYTWSRNLMDRGVENYDTGARRYYLSDQHRSHVLNSYGSYALPFGANGFLFRDASGAFKKAVEGWNLSWVASVSSGLPGSLTGGSSFWGISNPVLVRPDLWNNKSGDANKSTFYGDRYVKRPDAEFCANVYGPPDLQNQPTGMKRTCLDNRQALYLKSTGDLVIRNAFPGEIGNMTPNSLTGPGRWTFDLAMAKSVEFMEGKKIDFRIDAQNIFNHATPSGSADTFNHAPRYDVINQPEFGLNSTNPLGYIATKAGHRTFQAKIRISF